MDEPIPSLTSLPVGYNAVIIGSSGGIGSALCKWIAADPRIGELVTLSRSDDGFDLGDEATIKAGTLRLDGKPVHLLVCATGILKTSGNGPEKSIRQIDPQLMLEQFRINTVGPALVAKHFIPLLDRSTRSVAAFLSARVGSIGDNKLGGWISYRSSKAALNQVVRTAAIEVSRTHPDAIVTAVHPGTVRTTLSAPYSKGYPTVSAESAALSILQALDAAQNTGSFIAYDGSVVDW